MSRNFLRMFIHTSITLLEFRDISEVFGYFTTDFAKNVPNNRIFRKTGAKYPKVAEMCQKFLRLLFDI